MAVGSKQARGKAKTQAEFTKRKHWRQHFHPDQPYVWTKACTFNGEIVKAGDPVDKTKLRPGMLRRFWEAGRVRFANWTPPSTERDFCTNEELAARRAKEAAVGEEVIVTEDQGEGEGDELESGEANVVSGEATDAGESVSGAGDPPPAGGAETIEST